MVDWFLLVGSILFKFIFSRVSFMESSLKFLSSNRSFFKSHKFPVINFFCLITTLLFSLVPIALSFGFLMIGFSFCTHFRLDCFFSELIIIGYLYWKLFDNLKYFWVIKRRDEKWNWSKMKLYWSNIKRRNVMKSLNHFPSLPLETFNKRPFQSYIQHTMMLKMAAKSTTKELSYKYYCIIFRLLTTK